MEQNPVYILIVLRLVKKLTAFYGTLSIITRAQTRFLSQMNPANTIMSHFSIILSYMYRYFNLSLAFGCQATLFMYVLLSRMLHPLPISTSSCFYSALVADHKS